MEEEKQLQKLSTDILEQTECLEIACKTDYDMGAAIGKAAAGIEKKIIEHYEPMRVTAKAAYDTVLTQKKNDLKNVIKAKAMVKGKMIHWDQAEQKRAEDALREERKRLEALTPGIAETLPNIEEIAKTMKPDQPKGTSYRENWGYRVLNFDKVPREFLMVDNSIIMKEIAKFKGKAVIPGIEVYDKGTIAFRS